MWGSFVMCRVAPYLHLEGVWEIELSFSSYQVQTVNLLRSTKLSKFERISENLIVRFNASGTKKGILKHPLKDFLVSFTLFCVGSE